ncbi:MAG: hypothetical protein K0S47_1258 [Herbinix sp.]|jgi:hypothetical protein|nr:hypothetical protein [Herbinix sp.]
MQKIMETLFDAAYLVTVTILGITMVRQSLGRQQMKWFGTMAMILGFGDAFHLVPRVYALWTTGMEENAAALGAGKLITSITMTVFYVILYHIFRNRYHITGKLMLSVIVYGLSIVRIILCLLPQNQWLQYDAPYSWGIYRNIPFALLGLIIIYLFYTEAKKKKDRAFRFMWLAVTLSFAFYAPVVLFSDTIPVIGMLMIPKTLAYVWIVWMGYRELKESSVK